MNYPRALCDSLIKADEALEVISILKAHGYWDDETAWRPFADIENNFSSIGNQQGDSVAALVEKLTNSIDARFMNECSRKGINPGDRNYPNDMREAVAYLIEDKQPPLSYANGSLYFWPESQIQEESTNISLFATGKGAKAGYPSLTISDRGEGQTPDLFPETFMSMGKSNKMRIPFVQGKYNMGGTGVFLFCSDNEKHRVSFILSRRNPELLSQESKKNTRNNEWGFSVIRRITREGMKSPMFEYLAPLKSDGKYGNVLSFESESMNIFPSDDKDRPIAYRKSSTYGTMIKLYEYETKYKTNLTIKGSRGDSLKVKIEEMLPQAALPIQVAECREDYASTRGRRSFVDEVVGSVTQLEHLDETKTLEKMETAKPIKGTITIAGKPLDIQVFVAREFKDKAVYNTKGVFFTINGQTHGTLPSAFFGRKRVNLSYLRDSLFVVVDCTQMSPDIRSDTFMPSRDRIRDNEYSKEIQSQIEQFLGDDPALRDLNKKRHDDRVNSALEDQKPIEDTLKLLLKDNPQLAALLPFGIKIPTVLPGGGNKGGGFSKFVGKETPTYFRFKGNKNEIDRDSPINQNPRIGFETDAVDEYFVRKLSPGTLSISAFDERGISRDIDYRISNLQNGILNISLIFDPKYFNSGEKLAITFTISDDGNLDPFVNVSNIYLLDPVKVNSPGGKGKAKAPTDGGGGDGGNQSTQLPNIQPVREVEWELHGFTELTALRAMMNNDGTSYDFFYNEDNKYLKSFQGQMVLDAKVLDHQFKIGLVLISLSIIDANRQASESGEELKLGIDDIQILVGEVADAIAPFWLPLIKAMAGINVESEVSLD
jgi:hypothetical protein